MSVISGDREDEVNAEWDELFPFLSLPDELISHTFSFLSIKDRLRSRVNKRLDKIELKSKYHVEKLQIRELSTPDCPEQSKFQYIDFIHGRSYSSDCIKRLIQNASIGFLHIELDGSSDFHREVYNLIKEIDVEWLAFGLSNQLLSTIVDDSFFLDVSKACQKLYLYCRTTKVTPVALHQVYQMMMDGSTKLRKIEMESTKWHCIPFLGLIGITYRDGRFFSNRNIEAIEHVVDDYQLQYSRQRTRLFDGNIEIDLIHYIDMVDFQFGFTNFSLELHETEESLAEAKSRVGYGSVVISAD